MSTQFLEPGGDADFGIALWATSVNGPAVATDFVHGNHLRSIKYRPGHDDELITAAGTAVDGGGRASIWVYLNAYPDATTQILATCQSNQSSNIIEVRVTTAGVLRLTNNGGGTQFGSNGATLSLATWYRLCLVWTVSSTSVNQMKLFVGGSSSITATNVTLSFNVTSKIRVGNLGSNGALDFRSSDHYVDNSSALTDPGNIWVTAKRPFSNGTTNGFTTQIGSGGSGYGTGHAPQVNERPLSTTNGWSMVGAGSAVTEEYSIEGESAGDINITGSTIIDFMGWVDAKSATNETASLILAGSTFGIALTGTAAIFTTIAGSTAYPAGGTDIGIITTTAVTTVSLYECGIVVAYVPGSGTAYNLTATAAMLALLATQGKVTNKTLLGTTVVNTAITLRAIVMIQTAGMVKLSGAWIKQKAGAFSAAMLALSAAVPRSAGLVISANTPVFSGTVGRTSGKALNAVLPADTATLGKAVSHSVLAALSTLGAALNRSIAVVENASMGLFAGSLIATKNAVTHFFTVTAQMLAMSATTIHTTGKVGSATTATSSAATTRRIGLVLAAVTNTFNGLLSAVKSGTVHVLSVSAAMLSSSAVTVRSTGQVISAAGALFQVTVGKAFSRSIIAILNLFAGLLSFPGVIGLPGLASVKDKLYNAALAIDRSQGSGSAKDKPVGRGRIYDI